VTKIYYTQQEGLNNQNCTWSSIHHTRTRRNIESKQASKQAIIY
jgi:hypothetical protein